MKKQYSIKDLSIKVGKTNQTLYSLIKNNQELAAIVQEHTTRQGKFVKYDEVVLEWLLSYYGVEAPAAPGSPPAAPQSVQEEDQAKPSIAELQAKIAVLEAENKLLRRQLSTYEEERKEQREQLGQALLMLSQQQKLLLPPPKKSIVDTVKDIFKKKGTEK